MNARLTRFTLIAELALGSMAFGALYSVPMPLMAKVLVGALALLFAMYSERQSVHQLLYYEASSSFNEVAFRTLEAKLAASELQSLAEALASHAKSEKFRDIANGQGVSFGIVLCLKFACWLGVGAALSVYVFPPLLAKYG